MKLKPMLVEMLDGIGIPSPFYQSIKLQSHNADTLPSCFKVTELASNSFLSAACALAEYRQSMHSTETSAVVDKISVDNRLASLWFGKSLVARGWQPDDPWDSVAGDYACADGWIRLHTNAPHHKRAALAVVLGKPTVNEDDARTRIASAVRDWRKEELEHTVINSGGCAAAMQTLSDWQEHPQGLAVANEPLIHWQVSGRVNANEFSQATDRPLHGLRVLDLTRVLAGPVCTRFLAAYGADVLRIDPIEWDEPSLVPEVTLGKRCAHLDLKSKADRALFISLIESADVLVHGYRPGAMHDLGLSDEVLAKHNPALINISLCAYGWQGPWSMRRGFDSLVQMSCGIAHAGMQHYMSEKPHPLPVQALDHATGYLMAAATLHALAVRRKSGDVMNAKLSLARTAHVLQHYKQLDSHRNFDALHETDVSRDIEATPWGLVNRVKFPLHFPDIEARWALPACPLRTFPAQWLE